MVDAVSGEGRTGREGFVSELKVLISDRASGTGGALALLANVMPPAPLRRDRMLLRYQTCQTSDGPSWFWRGKHQLARQHLLWHAHLSSFRKAQITLGCLILSDGGGVRVQTVVVR